MNASWYFPKVTTEQSVLENDFKAIADMGFNHVLIPAIVTQKKTMSAEVAPPGEGDLKALSNGIDLARKYGLKVGLTGFLLVGDGSWRGMIIPTARKKWAKSYLKAITPYIQLASKKNVEMFCIASEMETMKAESEAWRYMLREVRAMYSGKIGFNMNWWYEKKGYDFIINEMSWMSELDFIGVSAYFPLTDKKAPSPDELSSAWDKDKNGQPVIEQMKGLKQRYTKQKVYIWEIGYRDLDGNNTDPANFAVKGEIDRQEQADCFNAFLTRYHGMGLDGFSIWAQNPGFSAKEPNEFDYPFIGKPAGEVIRSYLEKMR